MKVRLELVVVGLFAAAAGAYYLDSYSGGKAKVAELATPSATPLESPLESPPSAPIPEATTQEPAIPPPPAAGSDEVEKKMSLLEEILGTENEKDPRLLAQFHGLSPELKEKMRSYYRSLPAEKLKSRGIVIVALGQSAQTKEDFDFFIQVLAEAPCYNANSCAKKGKIPPKQVYPLAFPQVMANHMILQNWSMVPDITEKKELLKALRLALHSPNVMIVKSAQKALAAAKSAPGVGKKALKKPANLGQVK